MTNTTAIQNLVSDLVKVNGIFGLYSYASTVNPTTTVQNLTGKTSDQLFDYLETAGVSSTTIASIESSISQSNASSLLTNLLSTYNGGLYYNINEGNNNLSGSTSNDLIVNVDDIASTLIGNAGNDLLLNASSASSILQGGDGDDTLVNLSTASSTLEGGNGNDLLVSISTATSTLNGNAGNDTLINLGASAQMSGGDGADVLVGWDGNDTLTGGNGADNLYGGAGNDVLIGSSGNDTMTGSSGSDVFQLSASYSFSWSSFSFKWSTSGSDVIKDFSIEDKIQIDTNALGLAAKTEFNFQDGKLYVGNNVLATLEGVTSFNTNNIEFV